MTKITFDMESVAYKAQGVEGSIDPATLPESSLQAALAYGIRRMLQDDVNSRAKTIRDDGGNVNAKELVESRLKQFTDGTLGIRANSGMTDVEKVMHQLARRDYMATITDKDKKKAFAALTAAEVRGVTDAIVANDESGYREKAEAEIARRKAEAEKRAAQIADAMSAVAKAKIDLDALLRNK